MKIYSALPFLACCLVAAAHAVTIEKGDAFLADETRFCDVSAGAYTAGISTDGSLEIKSGESILIDGLWVFNGRKRVAFGDISRAGDDTVIVREGAVKDALDELDGEGGIQPEAADETASKVPGLKIKFRDGAIDFTPLGPKGKDGKTEFPYSVYFGIGADSVGASNVVLGIEEALPARRFAEIHRFSFYGHIGNCWPDIALVAADGAKCTVHASNGIDAATKAVNGYILAATSRKEIPSGVVGYLSESLKDTFTFDIAKAAEGGVRLAPVPMCRATPAHAYGLFPIDEPARFTLAFDAPVQAAKYRLEWTMVDHVQRPLGEGSAEFEVEASDKPVEVPVDIVSADAQPGYVYARAWLSRADTPSVRRYMTFEFGRCRFESDLLDVRPKWDVNNDVYAMNILGFRGIRMQSRLSGVWKKFKDKDDQEKIDWDAFKAYWKEYLDYCARGTVKHTSMLMEGGNDADFDKYFKATYGTDGDDKAWQEKRDETVARWYREYGAAVQELGLLCWEPINEPDLRLSSEQYMDGHLKPIYENFKAGGPNINFMGGSCCGLGKQPWVSHLYDIGADKYFDGISFHPYTGVGFLRVYRMNLMQWWKIFDDHGDDPSQGIFMTEAAGHRGWGYNDYAYDRFNARRESQAHFGLHMYLNAEACGIPREHVHVFYGCEHGYNDFFLLRRGSPTPSAIAFQVMNECLGDSKFRKEIPLPGHEHYFQLYGGDGRTVAALFTGGDRIGLDVATDADEVELTDCMGVRSILKPADGRVKVSFDNFPIFLRVPEGASLSPSCGKLEVAPNVALAALGAKIGTDCEPAPKCPDVSVLIDGDWSGFAGGSWTEAKEGSGAFPDNFDITLPKPCAVGSVTVYHMYGAWQRTLRDYDVQVYSDGEWKTVASLRGNYYAEATSHAFEPVTTDRVRVSVLGVNRCLFGGNISWVLEQTSLRGIEVHAVEGRKAAAFFADPELDKPKVKSGEPFELVYRLVSATGGDVSGTLRMALPDGWTAEEVPVSIAAGGETTVKVSITPGGGDGNATVVAGLYDSDGNLVSSDFDARVVEIR